VETVPAPATPLVDDETRRTKWAAKQLDGSRRLGTMELYRALHDAMDEGYELFDLSNREVRFALILMGGLNAALFLAASQTSFGAALSPRERQIEGVVLGIYVLLAVGFLLQAIAALRPGQFRPQLGDWHHERADFPVGIRYFEDVVQRSAAGHWDAWREVTISQLNAELAVQVHSLCLKNQTRKIALRRLYNSLRVLTILFGVILMLFVVFTIF
jgi:hypothetical protein